MKILILGCGRLGGRLAGDFSARGHEVIVVDKDPRAFRHLPPEFQGEVVLGTGIDEDVLRNAGIEQVEVFLAVTEEDNTNIMAAQLAQTTFRVPQVRLRIYDPIRAEIFRGLGLDVICPTTIVAGLLEEQVLGVAQQRA